jgi:hypothetical protein
MDLKNYKPVIGLEIHVQLATKSKMFSSSPNNPDEKEANTNIDEVVTGQPGTLPVLNQEAVRLGVMVGLALNCEIPEYSKFDRKHYFYPDLPKGYQISQYDEPIAQNGWVEISVPADIDIFMSCAPHALIHDIEDAIHRTFKSKILFTSGMAADVVSVRDFLPLEKDFLLISPQEEVTEVSVLKSGTPSSTAVYPQGTRTVVRTIAAGLQTSLHEAQSLLRMHAASMLDEPTDKRFREQASVAANQWCSSLKDVLLEMLPTRHMPSRIVVLASNETSAWLGGYMRHMFFPEFTTSQREFDVIICTTTTLHHFFRAAAGVQVDSGVVTKSIFINRI